jgi:hypothetical protein
MGRAKPFSEVFKDMFGDIKINPFVGYRLQQSGKKWRVMHHMFGFKEPKTEWLTRRQAEALLKIFKSGENNGNL